MKANWHVQAVRLAAQHPHKPWGEVCKAVAQRRSVKPPRPTPQQFNQRLEQLKLF